MIRVELQIIPKTNMEEVGLVVLTTLTTGLCEVIKATVPQVRDRMRLVALVTGLVVSFLGGVTEPLVMIMVGLAAQGLYSVAKEPINTTVNRLTMK